MIINNNDDSNNNDDDDDDDGSIEFLEERNAGGSSSSLPHLRANCTIHSFTDGRHIEFCENCYCYVCDTRTSDCKFWADHCRATNVGDQKSRWKKYKDDELEKRRVMEGKPKKKMKTILSFFKKATHTVPKVAQNTSIALTLTDAESTSSPLALINSSVRNYKSPVKSDAQNVHQRPQPPVAVSIADVFEWAVFEGPRCFNTGNILIPPQPHDRDVGPYRFVYCRICNDHHPSFPWALPKYRKCNTSLFKKHSESPRHLIAASTTHTPPTVY